MLESVLQSVNSGPESVDSITDFLTVGRLPALNMFNVFTSIQTADSLRPTIVCHRPTVNWSSGYGPLLSTLMHLCYLLCCRCHSYVGRVTLTPQQINLQGSCLYEVRDIHTSILLFNISYKSSNISVVMVPCIQLQKCKLELVNSINKARENSIGHYINVTRI